MSKIVRIRTYDRVVLFTIQPKVEYRLTGVEVNGEVAEILNGYPAYFSSEDDIVEYLNACGEDYEIVEESNVN